MSNKLKNNCHDGFVGCILPTPGLGSEQVQNITVQQLKFTWKTLILELFTINKILPVQLYLNVSSNKERFATPSLQCPA